MSRHPLRRGQVIVPFGVGSMNTYPDGVSYMVAGLDHWYPPGTNHDEFRVDEWRLADRLSVDHFRLPPDFRPRHEARDKRDPNLELTLPAVRFPGAHTCGNCGRLDLRPLTDGASQIRCQECRQRGRYGYLSQVQVVAVCEAGHIQDFPWSEWAHRSLQAPAGHAVKVYASGSAATLSGLWAECDCGERRNLGGVTGMAGRATTADGAAAVQTSTQLSENLANGPDAYVCAAARPWLGGARDDPRHCGRPLRASLRSAANTYFAEIATAIFVPRTSGRVPPELLEKLRRPPATAPIRAAEVFGGIVTPEKLREFCPGLFDDFSDEQISLGLEEIRTPPDPVAADQIDAASGETTEQGFRKLEFEALVEERTDVDLTVRRVPRDRYHGDVRRLLRSVSLVDRLRVTRAFTGFSRVEPRPSAGRDVYADMLWRTPPNPQNRWLPAALVFGEGILLEMDPNHVRAWSERNEVNNRVDTLMTRYERNGGRPSVVVEEVTPVSVALHTLAHLLILELSFHSGYAATSLAERLYVSSPGEDVRAALLLYTAAGDTEGTMGGLVRLGRPGALEPILARALVRAEWCSADPVCSELGTQVGQGPDGCNLASCYACSIVPETSCEDFNRFLDRELVVGHQLGLFAS